MFNGKKKSNKAFADTALRITQCELGYKEIFTGSTSVENKADSLDTDSVSHKESQEIKNDEFILNTNICDIFDKDNNNIQTTLELN